MTAKRHRSNWPWIVALVVVGGAFAAYRAGWLSREETVALQGAPVQRGPLVISVVQRGNLAAKDAVVVTSEIEGQTTILSLIAEGTIVQPGDLLVELDVSEIREKRIAQEIALQNADAAYVKAQAQFDIQENQNKSDIEAAERKLDFAKLDLAKYTSKNGDREQLVAQADEKIALAEAEKAKAENTVNWSKNLADRKFLTLSELERDQLEFQRATITLTQAQRAKDLFLTYDDLRDRRELEANVSEADLGLARTKLQAKARIVDYEAAVATNRSKLELEKERLKDYVDQHEKGRIVAKDAGMVVYARVDSGGRMGGSEPIQKGSQVRERQEILSIPRTGGLIAEASVHEAVLKQVAVGMSCRIRVDAIPGEEFDGRVQFVALLPDKASWWANPNQRLYKCEIAVLATHPDMRPGMSCSVEILSDRIDETLYVPLQAITLDQGETVAFVAKGDNNEMRRVDVGKSSDKWVQVLKGLEGGETVLLAPPPGFTPKASEDRGGNGNGANGRGPAGARGDPAAMPVDPSAIPPGERRPDAGGEMPRDGSRRRGEGAAGGDRSRRPRGEGGFQRGERPSREGGGDAGGGASAPEKKDAEKTDAVKKDAAKKDTEKTDTETKDTPKKDGAVQTPDQKPSDAKGAPVVEGERQPVAVLQDVTRVYRMGSNEVRALDGFSFTFKSGEYWSIMGSSGSGKSTLLNILGCIDRPTSGSYQVRGEEINDLDDDALSDLRSRQVGFVFQSYNLIQQLDVLENILVPLFYQDDPPEDGEERARALAERVGLGDRLEHTPMELSGGQQQRVAIARALVNDPAIVLADEATGNLDSKTALEILSLFDELHAEGKTILLVTHEPSIGARAQRTLKLRDGRIEDVSDNR